jgi:hypothetical protein
VPENLKMTDIYIHFTVKTSNTTAHEISLRMVCSSDSNHITPILIMKAMEINK